MLIWVVIASRLLNYATETMDLIRLHVDDLPVAFLEHFDVMHYSLPFLFAGILGACVMEMINFTDALGLWRDRIRARNNAASTENEAGQGDSGVPRVDGGEEMRV